MSRQPLTFADFISIMFDPHELVWTGKGTKTSGCIVKPGSIVPAQSLEEGHSFFTPNSLKTSEKRTEDNANFHTLFCECDSLAREEQRWNSASLQAFRICSVATIPSMGYHFDYAILEDIHIGQAPVPFGGPGGLVGPPLPESCSR